MGRAQRRGDRAQRGRAHVANGPGEEAFASDLADRIAQLELRTQHDVVAFCESLAEQLPPAVARYVHFGATSSDIIDTALALQLRATLQIVQAELQAVLRQLWQPAQHETQKVSWIEDHVKPHCFGQLPSAQKTDETRST